jgi:hypothetical protein
MSYEFCEQAKPLKHNKYNTPIQVGVCTHCFFEGGLFHLNFRSGFF